MARLGRYFLPDQPLHVIQRGNNREAVFYNEKDYAVYRDWLDAAAAKHALAVHAYVLMTNHVHLLVTPRKADSVPRTMQALGRRYVRYVNAAYGHEPEPCGRAAIVPRRSTARRISWRAAAISNSIRCERAWSGIRAIIAGRAIAPTPKAAPILF